MNRADLTEEISRAVDISRKESDTIVATMLDRKSSSPYSGFWEAKAASLSGYMYLHVSLATRIFSSQMTARCCWTDSRPNRQGRVEWKPISNSAVGFWRDFTQSRKLRT